MVTELRNRHNLGDFAGGINVRNGTISDMWAEKIVQPLLVNTSEIQLATECVGMILKIGKWKCYQVMFLLYIYIYCENKYLIIIAIYNDVLMFYAMFLFLWSIYYILPFITIDDLIPVR